MVNLDTNCMGWYPLQPGLDSRLYMCLGIQKLNAQCHTRERRVQNQWRLFLSLLEEPEVCLGWPTHCEASMHCRIVRSQTAGAAARREDHDLLCNTRSYQHTALRTAARLCRHIPPCALPLLCTCASPKKGNRASGTESRDQPAARETRSS